MSYFDIAVKFYSNPENISKIVPFLKDRETACLNKIAEDTDKIQYVRYKRVQNENDFNWNVLKLMTYNNTVYNVYNSVGFYKGGIPIISYAGMSSEQSKLNKENFCKNHWKNMIGYDWVLDFDSPDYKLLKHIAKDVLTVWNQMSLEFENIRVVFTGCGFQLVVPFESLKLNKSFNPLDSNNIYFVFKSLTEELHKNYSECIDLSIFDERRIHKTPNCLVFNTYKTKDIYVSKLLSKKDLENFDLKMVIFNEKN